MIKYTRFFITFLSAAIALGANAQSQTTATSSSPYSAYGLGDINPSILPQTAAMGGIATAINRISGYNNINVLNPSSYATINFTTIDAGIYTNFVTLNQTGQPSAKTSNFRISHVTFAIPVTKHAALSFGLLPYSEVGYNNKQTYKNFGSGTPTDTSAVNTIFSGNGGLSKAYIGYGFTIAKHLHIGANASYIFGNISQYQSTEIPTLYGVLDTRQETNNTIGGVAFDLGAQYEFDISETKHLVLGYSTSLSSSINNTSSYLTSQYTYDGSGNQNSAADTLIYNQNTVSKIKLPSINHFGISFQSDQRFIIGADYTIGQWSSLSISGTNAGLQNSKTFNLGGQFTPDANALRGYFSRIDYRMGLLYDQTYLNLNNTNINRYALTFGFGLPLSPTLSSFYKVNFSAEIGKRGTLENSLVKENYVNLRLGFTINDRWFQRFRFQ